MSNGANDLVNNIKMYNGTTYYMYVRLYNPDGDEIVFTNDAITELVIKDELTFWPVNGFLIYENPYEIMESKFVSNSDITNEAIPAAIQIELKNRKPYRFRNDGKDFLDITIRPQLEGGEGLPVQNFPPELWEIKYTCVIYDTEDLPASNLSKKSKKFYFWDSDYQKMLENNIQWSTATSSLNPAKLASPSYVASLATDEQRKMTTGLAIKSILQDQGFAIDTANFDKGSTKILYTTWQDMNIWSHIEYILQNHMSEKTTGTDTIPGDLIDICIFNKDRHTAKFELQSLYKYFEKAGSTATTPGDYQIEHLFFDEVARSDQADQTTSPYKAPITATIETKKDIKIDIIREYKFIDMSGGDNTHYLVTTPVHSYNFQTKTFSIHLSTSNMTTLNDQIKAHYITKKLLSKNEAHSLINVNQTKLENKRVRPVYSVRSDMNHINAAGLGKLLKTSIFLNQGLHFQIDGAPFRQSGRFIGIDKKTFSDNNFDYKLCGQWFVTDVVHYFKSNQYKNEVTAVKIHSYDDLNMKTTV